MESERVVDLVKQLVASQNVNKNLSAILELKQVASFFERQHKAEKRWRKIRKQLARFEEEAPIAIIKCKSAAWRRLHLRRFDSDHLGQF